MFLRRKMGTNVRDVNIKLQIRVINRHIIPYIMGWCDRCEYKATMRVINRHIKFICFGLM